MTRRRRRPSLKAILRDRLEALERNQHSLVSPLGSELRRLMRPKLPPKCQPDWPRLPSDEEMAELYLEWQIATGPLTAASPASSALR